jgi:hypothetical protein
MEGALFFEVFAASYIIFASSALFLFDKPWIAGVTFLFGLGCLYVILDTEYSYLQYKKRPPARSLSPVELKEAKYRSIVLGWVALSIFTFGVLSGSAQLLGTLCQSDYCLALFSGWPFNMVLATNVVPQKQFIWFFVMCSYLMSLHTASYLVTKCAFLNPTSRESITWLLRSF